MPHRPGYGKRATVRRWRCLTREQVATHRLTSRCKHLSTDNTAVKMNDQGAVCATFRKVQKKHGLLERWSKPPLPQTRGSCEHNSLSRPALCSVRTAPSRSALSLAVPSCTVTVRTVPMCSIPCRPIPRRLSSSLSVH